MASSYITFNLSYQSFYPLPQARLSNRDPIGAQDAARKGLALISSSPAQTSYHTLAAALYTIQGQSFLAGGAAEVSQALAAFRQATEHSPNCWPALLGMYPEK